jgi:ABC-2 type transport system permease protein
MIETVASPVTPPQPGLTQALRSEWTKVRTARATAWTPLVMVAIVPVIAVFVGLTTSLQPDDTILGGSLTGATPAQVAAAIFGVLVITTEYTTGTIRATLTARPQRATVLLSKAAVVAGGTFLVSFVTSVIGYQIGDLMLSGEGYAQGDAMPALIGVAACFAATGVLGVAIGTLLRRSAGAIVAIIGIMMLPSLFGPLLGDWQRWVAGASPAATLQKFTQTSDATPDVVGSLGPWPSLALLGTSTAAVLAASIWRFKRRDA